MFRSRSAGYVPEKEAPLQPHNAAHQPTDAMIIADGMYALADALHAIAKALATGPEDSPDEAPTQYMDGTPVNPRPLEINVDEFMKP